MNMKTKTPKDYLKEPYAFLLMPDAESGTYAAEVQEFEGCFSQGRTADEAMANLREAAENWIEATLQQGRPIPRPFATIEVSGKFALRLPVSLHEKVQRLADRDEVSVNTFLVEAIAEKVGAIEYVDRHMVKLDQKMATRTVANLHTLFDLAEKFSPMLAVASTIKQKPSSAAGLSGVVINNFMNVGDKEWRK